MYGDTLSKRPATMVPKSTYEPTTIPEPTPSNPDHFILSISIDSDSDDDNDDDLPPPPLNNPPEQAPPAPPRMDSVPPEIPSDDEVVDD